MKIAIAIALVGAIIGELPTGSQGGFGARMLNGSYYGQTLIIWSALIGSAVIGALAIWIGLWALNITIVRRGYKIAPWIVPILFGAALLILWEGAVRGFDVPLVILPAPSMIWVTLTNSLPTATRPPAHRQSGRRPAHRRHRAHHGHVVRFRLAFQGRRGRCHVFFPHAGEHRRGPARR